MPYSRDLPKMESFQKVNASHLNAFKAFLTFTRHFYFFPLVTPPQNRFNLKTEISPSIFGLLRRKNKDILTLPKNDFKIS